MDSTPLPHTQHTHAHALSRPPFSLPPGLLPRTTVAMEPTHPHSPRRLAEELSLGQLEVLGDVLYAQLRAVGEARVDRVRRQEREHLFGML